jgi:hypothetical protein
VENLIINKGIEHMEDNRIVDIKKLQDFKAKTRKKQLSPTSPTGYSFSAEVEKDVSNLSEALNVTKDEAVKIATDFYKRYPMLLEFVRSPENM